jgi:hypothetical protein
LNWRYKQTSWGLQSAGVPRSVDFPTARPI